MVRLSLINITPSKQVNNGTLRSTHLGQKRGKLNCRSISPGGTPLAADLEGSENCQPAFRRVTARSRMLNLERVSENEDAFHF